MNSILSVLIFLPLLVAVILSMVPRRFVLVFRWATLAVTLLQIAAVVLLYINFDQNSTALQFVEKYSWINFDLGPNMHIQIEYLVGIDGIALSLLSLSAFVLFIASISSFEIAKNHKLYFLLFNVLNTALMGVFSANDFFLFYVFYELVLLPLYFLIGMWGGANREYAAIKFFIYTLFGSVFMLLVMVGLYFSVIDPTTGLHTFNMQTMMNPANYVSGSLFAANSNFFVFEIPIRFWAFIVLFVGFAIKLPSVPFHTWLPDAHVEAPTPVSIILAALLLKVGAYAMIRICFGMFPDASIYYSYYISLLGMASIIYGALNAFGAEDLKKLIAYSSVSHMGFVMIGLASLREEGVNGAVFQLVSHGILSAMLFFVVGVLYHRVHDRSIANFRGLAKQMPRFTIFVVIAFFASLGLPGMSGFIGEAFTLFGAFMAHDTTHTVPLCIAVLSLLGILMGAGYFLQTLQKMFYGEKRFKLANWESQLTDISNREIFVLSLLAVATIIFGLFPSLLFQYFDQNVQYLIQQSFQNGYSLLSNVGEVFKP